jgi:hypothetical protein
MATTTFGVGLAKGSTWSATGLRQALLFRKPTIAVQGPKLRGLQRRDSEANLQGTLDETQREVAALASAAGTTGVRQVA